MSDTGPVASFKAAAPLLRRPFTEQAIKFKVQVTWPKDNPHTGLIVPYIDARLVVERLNAVCPHLWFDEYEPVPGGQGLLCRLTVDGITRLDIGDGYRGKGLYSDALKRAAVKFGVGVSLYAIPKMILKADEGHVEVKKAGSRKTLALTPNGETHCQTLYASWLDTLGRNAFGDPLDHGDAEGAAGDPEGETAVAEAEAAVAQAEPEKLTDAKATALIEGVQKLYADLPREAKRDMPRAQFTRLLASAWHSHDELEKLIENLEKRGAK